MLVQKILQNVKKIAVKKLLFVIEMSLQANNKLDYNTFMESYDASVQNEIEDSLEIWFILIMNVFMSINHLEQY